MIIRHVGVMSFVSRCWCLAVPSMSKVWDMVLADDRDLLQIPGRVLQVFFKDDAFRKQLIHICADTRAVIPHHLSAHQLPDLQLQSCKKLPIIAAPFQPAT